MFVACKKRREMSLPWRKDMTSNTEVYEIDESMKVSQIQYIDRVMDDSSCA